jgi:hypothetical protein
MNNKVILSTATHDVDHIIVETQISRELRVPARMAAMMIASDKTLHEVKTLIFIAVLCNGDESVMTRVEESSRELTADEIHALQTRPVPEQTGWVQG